MCRCTAKCMSAGLASLGWCCRWEGRGNPQPVCITCNDVMYPPLKPPLSTPKEKCTGYWSLYKLFVRASYVHWLFKKKKKKSHRDDFYYCVAFMFSMLASLHVFVKLDVVEEDSIPATTSNTITSLFKLILNVCSIVKQNTISNAMVFKHCVHSCLLVQLRL